MFTLVCLKKALADLSVICCIVLSQLAITELDIYPYSVLIGMYVIIQTIHRLSNFCHQLVGNVMSCSII